MNDKKIPSSLVLDNDLAFLFGCYLGDGHSNFNGGNISITISRGYKEQFLERIVNTFKKFNLSPTVKYQENSKVILISIFSRSLCNFFLDSFGKNAYTKYIPKFLFKSSNSVISNFLWGWYITDGSHRKNTIKGQRITTVSKRAVWDGVSLGLLYGILLGVNKYSSKKENEADCYDLNFDSLSIQKLGWDIPINKKFSPNYGEDNKYFYLKINKIEEKIYNGIVYDKTTSNNQYNIPFIVHNSKEDEQGLPFVWQSGFVLDEVLSLLEIKRKSLYISNIIHCRAFWIETNKDRSPNEVEINACRNYTNNIIQVINPKIIVTLGNIPLKFFFPNSLGITKLAVHGIWKKWNNIDILPLYHPSFVKRNGGLKSLRGKEFMNDFKKIKEYLND